MLCRRILCKRGIAGAVEVGHSPSSAVPVGTTPTEASSKASGSAPAATRGSQGSTSGTVWVSVLREMESYSLPCTVFSASDDDALPLDDVSHSLCACAATRLGVKHLVRASSTC